jgi:DNA-binding beta-propeller fold protein YncE
MKYVRYAIFFACAVAICAPPAGNRPAHRADSGTSVLPGGREITPLGQQFFTGPGPFGIAVNASGNTVVAADGGPNRYALSVLNLRNEPKITHINAHRKRDNDDKKGAVTDDDDADWQGVFMGLAFDGDSRLFASEGESGQVRLIDVESGKRLARFDLNSNGFKDSYSGDLVFDGERGLLYVVDQANFRLAVVDTKKKTIVQSIRTGRLPFAIALSPDKKTAYVTNVGMFEYSAIPGADAKQAKETGLPFPPFGFPSPEAVKGAKRETEKGVVNVQGLGAPNARGSNSLAVIDVANAAAPKIVADVHTGLPFGGAVLGGSSPSGVLATDKWIFVSNANQDTITAIDAKTHKRETDFAIRIRGFESLRGVMPIGMAVSPDLKKLLVAEAGINAIGVIDVESRRVIGHIPAGWFPTAIKVFGNTVFVANAKGHGTGPSSDREARAARSFQGELRQGTISKFEMPKDSDLPKLTAQVMANNGFGVATESSGLAVRPAAPAPLPQEIDHVVIIVKENKTYDEVFGDLPAASNGPRDGIASLAHSGLKITPNHHALATRFASSDNFYADSEVSADGHHWLVGSYPNAWTESTWMGGYGGQKQYRFPTNAPGRYLFAGSAASVHPEEQLEAGSIWHHLDRNGVTFRNFGEGFEFAGLSEAENLEPTGARFLTNIPMPDPLYRNTSRNYPGFNMNIPDQYRASHFIAEIDERYVKSKAALPKFLFIHLPNDHKTKAHPDMGYPVEESYVADNDLALGRIVEYLSHTEWWPKMAIFVTEDDALGGVDHVDTHRTVFLAIGPHVKRNYNARVNTSFPGMLRMTFELLKMPPLNFYDATAADLSECFQSAADVTPYTALAVDPKIFDPEKAKIDKKSKGPAMDDPAEVRRQQRQRR